MKNNEKTRKAKAGLLLVASPRFKDLGVGCEHGTYGERKEIAIKEIQERLSFLDISFPGIVYTREDAEKAMSLLQREGRFCHCRIPFMVGGLCLDSFLARYA